MANYKVPRRVIFTDNLPLNASGKVLNNIEDYALITISVINDATC